MIKILFIGDIVGRPGRAILKQRLKELRAALGLDLVIANAENAAGGSGLTVKIAEELSQAGIDALTLGDHVWGQRGFESQIDALDYVCRPANLPLNCPGRTVLTLTHGDSRISVFTVLGREFMKVKANCPFVTADELIKTLTSQNHALIVEIHAEVTSEKIALGWYLDGRVAAVLGTHTHVPTADGCILPRGTAYLTDLGMTGPYASCLGRERQPIISRFIDGMPRPLPVATKDIRLCGALVHIDPDSRLPVSFKPVILRTDDPVSSEP